MNIQINMNIKNKIADFDKLYQTDQNLPTSIKELYETLKALEQLTGRQKLFIDAFFSISNSTDS